MKESTVATIQISIKGMYDVYVNTTSYQGEPKPEPKFNGQLHAVLIRPHEREHWRNLDRYNGSGCEFYMAVNGEWKETKI